MSKLFKDIDRQNHFASATCLTERQTAANSRPSNDHTFDYQTDPEPVEDFKTFVKNAMNASIEDRNDEIEKPKSLHNINVSRLGDAEITQSTMFNQLSTTFFKRLKPQQQKANITTKSKKKLDRLFKMAPD